MNPQSKQRLSGSERREQLSAAALRILAERGVGGLTTRALAAEVGLRDGSIFRHFASKEAIVDAAIARFESTLREDLPSEDGSPLERLRRFFVVRLAKLRERPELLKLALSDRLEEVAGPEGAARLRALLADQHRFVARSIREAQGSGELHGEVAPAVLTWMVMGTMRGAARSSAMSPDEVFDDVVAALGAATRGG